MTPASGGSEVEWFAAEPSEVWTSLSDARVTEAEWIRLYADSLDLCLRYEIAAKVGRTYDDGTNILHVIRRRGWNRSVFALVPEWTEWPYAFPEPDDKIEWRWDGRMICGWFHWTLLGGPVSVHAESEEPPLFKEPTDEEEDARLSAVRDSLKEIEGADVLSPSQAHNMIALMGDDPFPDSETRVFHTGEVTSYLDQVVPSPILPAFREFRVEVVWFTEIDLEELRGAVQAASQSCDLMVDGWTLERDGSYVIAQTRFTPLGIDTLPTAAILRDLAASLKCWADDVERRFAAGTLGRRTKEYWRAKHGVALGVPWHQSLKPIVWRPDKDGNTRAFSGVDLNDGSGEPDLEKVFGPETRASKGIDSSRE